MRFYKKATIEDIQSRKKEFENHLPQEVIDLVHSTDYMDNLKATPTLRRYKGYGIQECRHEISEYISILQAEKDFLNGEIIYTDYYVRRK